MNISEEIAAKCGLCSAVIYETIEKMGGRCHIRVMELRRAMPVKFGESTIKKHIRTLLDEGYIAREGEMYDSRGFAYRIAK